MMQNERSSTMRPRVAVTGPRLLCCALASLVSDFDGGRAAAYSDGNGLTSSRAEPAVWLLLSWGASHLREELVFCSIRPILLMVMAPPTIAGREGSARAAEELLRAGGTADIRAFISAEDRADEVRRALRAAVSGEAYCSPALVPYLVRALPVPGGGNGSAAVPSGSGPRLWGLTEREHEVAALAAQGLTNEEIGQRLFVGVNTVKSHLKQIFRKGGLTSRGQLAHRWAEAHNVTLVYSHGKPTE